MADEAGAEGLAYRLQLVVGRGLTPRRQEDLRNVLAGDVPARELKTVIENRLRDGIRTIQTEQYIPNLKRSLPATQTRKALTTLLDLSARSSALSGKERRNRVMESLNLPINEAGRYDWWRDRPGPEYDLMLALAKVLLDAVGESKPAIRLDNMEFILRLGRRRNELSRIFCTVTITALTNHIDEQYLAWEPTAYVPGRPDQAHFDRACLFVRDETRYYCPCGDPYGLNSVYGCHSTTQAVQYIRNGHQKLYLTFPSGGPLPIDQADAVHHYIENGYLSVPLPASGQSHTFAFRIDDSPQPPRRSIILPGGQRCVLICPAFFSSPCFGVSVRCEVGSLVFRVQPPPSWARELRPYSFEEIEEEAQLRDHFFQRTRLRQKGLSQSADGSYHFTCFNPKAGTYSGIVWLENTKPRREP